MFKSGPAHNAGRIFVIFILHKQRMKKAIFSVALLATLLAVYAFSIRRASAPEGTSGIKWMTWQQMQEAQKTQPRKVFVDVYTEWCGWCKRMDASTFSNAEIISYVNENYYAVKFDAETQSTITFKGKDYKFVPQGYRGYNELAAEILEGQLSYPTSVYMDENLNVIFPVPGYREPKEFEQIINYVHSNAYKNKKFEDYQKEFKGKIQ